MNQAPPAPPKPRYPANDALAVARELCAVLKPATTALMAVGSLRRRRPTVGDLELLFIPKLGEKPDPQDLLGRKLVVDEIDLAIWRLLTSGILAKRPNVNGSATWGPLNKLAVHAASGLPVDLFAANTGNWWCQVVCRTGSAGHNVRVCEAAQAKGWKWNPYGEGLYDRHGALQRKVLSERDLFEAVGLPWLEPWERNL